MPLETLVVYQTEDQEDCDFGKRIDSNGFTLCDSDLLFFFGISRKRLTKWCIHQSIAPTTSFSDEVILLLASRHKKTEIFCLPESRHILLKRVEPVKNARSIMTHYMVLDYTKVKDVIREIEAPLCSEQNTYYK